MNLDENFIVGMDIGGTHIRIGALDGQMTLRFPMKIATRDVLSGDCPREALVKFIRGYLSTLPYAVRAISIGFPSTLNRDRSKVLSTPNIKGLDNVESEDFSRSLRTPVFFEKDSCMLMYYDIHSQCIPLEGVVIGCYIGTGLGNIIMIDGNPLSGKDGVACELGHIPVMGRNDLCGCGNAGCIETYAAGIALEKICRNEFQESGNQIGSVFQVHGLSSSVLHFIENIAVAIATEVNILNPDVVVLGGGVIAMPDFPIAYLEKCLYSHVRKPYPAESLQIRYSISSQPYNGVIGAAVFAVHKLKQHAKVGVET